MGFEKDICGDPRIQPGSLVSLSSMSKDVFVDELGKISIALLAHIFLKKNGAYKYENILQDHYMHGCGIAIAESPAFLGLCLH